MEIQILLNKLHDSQQEIVRTKRRFNILKCGRRFGKTELMIDIVCNAALDGFPCGYWSPTYKDLYEVWKEVKRVLEPVTKRKDEQVKQIELITGGKVDFNSICLTCSSFRFVGSHTLLSIDDSSHSSPFSAAQVS